MMMAQTGTLSPTALGNVRAVRSVLQLARLKGYYWDASKAQYISKWNGQAVLERTILSKTEGYIDNFVRPNIDGITQKFIAGQIDLATWQQRVARELKDGHRIALVIGRGGVDNVTFSDWGRMGSRLSKNTTT